MSELYTLKAQGSDIVFEPREDAAMEDLLAQRTGIPAALGKRWSLAARMGDPELLHCAVWRGQPGGCFVLYNEEGVPLLAAMAESNLTYALGLAHFGRMVAEARYGADIYENLGDDDD